MIYSQMYVLVVYNLIIYIATYKRHFVATFTYSTSTATHKHPRADEGAEAQTVNKNGLGTCKAMHSMDWIVKHGG